MQQTTDVHDVYPSGGTSLVAEGGDKHNNQEVQLAKPFLP
jgi:hypothetical protein